MPELIRSIVDRLREYAGDRRRASRRRARLLFKVSIHYGPGELNGRRPPRALEGYTRDFSRAGIALVVPAIHIGGSYLTGEDRRLRLVLELPSGPIELIVAPVRYEPIEDDPDEQGFVIGSTIVEVSPPDRERLDSYLSGKTATPQ